MNKKFLTLIAALSLMLGTCVLADDAENPSLVHSKDGMLQLIVPEGWKQKTNPKPSIAIEVVSSAQSSTVIIDSKLKSDVSGVDLADFGATAIKRFAAHPSSENIKIGDAEHIQVDGKDAIRYKVEGSKNNIDFVMFFTFTATDTRYNQFISVAPKRLVDKAMVDFDFIAAHLAEVKKQ